MSEDARSCFSWLRRSARVSSWRMSSERRVFNSMIAAMFYSPGNAFIHLKHFLGQFLCINFVGAIFQCCANLRNAVVVHFRVIAQFLFQLLQVFGLITETDVVAACSRALSLRLLSSRGGRTLAACCFVGRGSGGVDLAGANSI